MNRKLQILILKSYNIKCIPGDVDPAKSIVAETSKLIGNSVYGHSLMNKSKHSFVKFCNRDKASSMVNNPLFRDVLEFRNEAFEVSRILNTRPNSTNNSLRQVVAHKNINMETIQVRMQKKNIKHDLPVQLGFFVYGYAKLKMLEFMYDVIDKFISREDYCLLEMDTG